MSDERDQRPCCLRDRGHCFLREAWALGHLGVEESTRIARLIRQQVAFKTCRQIDQAAPERNLHSTHTDNKVSAILRTLYSYRSWFTDVKIPIPIHKRTQRNASKLPHISQLFTSEHCPWIKRDVPYTICIPLATKTWQIREKWLFSGKID